MPAGAALARRLRKPNSWMSPCHRSRPKSSGSASAATSPCSTASNFPSFGHHHAKRREWRHDQKEIVSGTAGTRSTRRRRRSSECLRQLSRSASKQSRSTGPIRLRRVRPSRPSRTRASLSKKWSGASGSNVSLDVFNNRYIINGKGVAGLTDSDLTDPVVRVLRELSRMHFGLDPGKEQMGEALQRAKGSP